MIRILILVITSFSFNTYADCVGSSCAPIHKAARGSALDKKSQVAVPQCDIYNPDAQLSQKQDSKNGKATK